MTLHTFVTVAHGVDPVAWPARHARGEVPNRLPFGVDALEDHGVALTVRPLLQHPAGRRVARAVRARAGDLEWVEAVRDVGRSGLRRADVQLCWDEWSGVPAALLARPGRTPPVVSGVMNLSDWLHPAPGFVRVARAGLSRAARLWVHAPVQVDALQRTYGIDPTHVEVVPMGVDADWFTPRTAAPDRDLVASVGDDGHRDHAALVRAVEEVRRVRPSTRLALATLLPAEVPPDAGTVVREKLGPRRPAFYGGAAVVAVAAEDNVHGSGLSVCLEAMACGRPFVATDSPAFAGYLDSGEAGLLVPPGDPDAFAKALRSLLEDPERADEMGRAGRRLVEQRFNTRLQGERLAAVLHDVAGRG